VDGMPEYFTGEVDEQPEATMATPKRRQQLKARKFRVIIILR